MPVNRYFIPKDPRGSAVSGGFKEAGDVEDQEEEDGDGVGGGWERDGGSEKNCNVSSWLDSRVIFFIRKS